MKTVDAKRVVSYQAEDSLARISITMQLFEGARLYDIAMDFNGVPVGSFVIDRDEDMVMFADALADYVETRNLRCERDEKSEE